MPGKPAIWTTLSAEQRVEVIAALSRLLRRALDPAPPKHSIQEKQDESS